MSGNRDVSIGHRSSWPVHDRQSTIPTTPLATPVKIGVHSNNNATLSLSNYIGAAPPLPEPLPSEGVAGRRLNRSFSCGSIDAEKIAVRGLEPWAHVPVAASPCTTSSRQGSPVAFTARPTPQQARSRSNSPNGTAGTSVLSSAVTSKDLASAVTLLRRRIKEQDQQISQLQDLVAGARSHRASGQTCWMD